MARRNDSVVSEKILMRFGATISTPYINLESLPTKVGRQKLLHKLANEPFAFLNFELQSYNSRLYYGVHPVVKL